MRPTEIVIDHPARVVSLEVEGAGALELHVPALFGEILHAERRGAFVLVKTAGGRVSFHAGAPRRVADAAWRLEHPLAGKLHWHSLRKALKTHCLLPALADRVEFFITHHAFKTGGSSSSGGAGRITVDGAIVCRFAAEPPAGGFRPAELGGALATYLTLDVRDALASPSVLVASVALLDRRLTRERFGGVEEGRFEHPLWASFHALRASALE
jgi:hypothetical protein